MHRVFLGHHKCASRFFRLELFRSIARRCGWQIISYQIDEPPYHFDDLPDLDLHNLDYGRLRDPEPAVVTVLNASPEVVTAVDEASPDFRGLRVVRDPRQVLVSAYFHHRDGHPVEGSTGYVWDKLAQDRVILRELPVEEGLLYELDNITGTVLDDQISAWVPDERVLEVRVEDVNRRRRTFLRRLSAHLGLWFTPRVRWRRAYSDSGAGHWRRHFTPKVHRGFMDRYSGLLKALGYDGD